MQPRTATGLRIHRAAGVHFERTALVVVADVQVTSDGEGTSERQGEIGDVETVSPKQGNAG